MIASEVAVGIHARHFLVIIMVIRSTFFSLGMFALLWGAIFLACDRILLESRHDGSNPGFPGTQVLSPNGNRLYELRLPDWVPLALMCAGSLVMLYSIKLNTKQG